MSFPARLRTGLLVTVSAAALFGAGWVTARRTLPPLPKPDVQASNLPVGAAVPEDSPGSTGPGAKPSATPQNPKLPASAVKLLDSLDTSGSLANQTAILKYATSLDLASAKAAAMAYVGKAYSSDKKSNLLSSAVFARWAELDPQGVINAARTSGDRNFRNRALNVGFEAMAQKSPKGAWEATLQMGPMKAEAQRAVLNSISSTDPRQALGLASELNGYYARSAIQNIMNNWADKDPAGASAAVLAMPMGADRSGAVGVVSGRWALNDFEGAKAWAASLSNPSERLNATSSAMYSLCQVDPEKTLALLDSTDVGANSGYIVQQAISSIALKDFDQAMGMLSGFKSFREKQSALAGLAGVASEENRDRLLALAGTLPANLARSIYEGGVWRGMESDPDATLAMIDKIPIAAVKEQAMQQALDSLSYSKPDQAAEIFGKLQPASQNPEQAGNLANIMAWADPEKAVTWANQLGNEALKKAALSQAINTWAQSDPDRAAQEISKIANADTRAEVTRSVTDSLAGRSLAEAEQWASTLTGADRTAALGKIVEQAAGQAPDRVQSLYSEFAGGLSQEDAARSENQGIARSVATQLAQTDAAKAATWSQTLPEGGARDEAVSGVVATWASYDAVGASQWLQQLPEGKGRDLATGNLVNTIARDDPESAWAWANSISDTARRRDAAAAALGGWKANGNRDAALAALDAAGFSEADYKELARKLD